MDFQQFDSVSAAEKGAECHILHPVTQAPLFDNPGDPTKDNGKPCIVVVLGAEAPTVREINRANQKARAKAKPKGEARAKAKPEGEKTSKTDQAAEGDPDALEDEEFSLDDLHDRMVQSLAPRIVGFKNISKGSRLATKKDAQWFLNLNRLSTQEGERSFAQQVGDFSSKRANYLGNALKG